METNNNGLTDLKIRIKLLEAVFQPENLYSDFDRASNRKKLSKNTVEKWCSGSPTPTTKSQRKLCGAVGIPVTFFSLNLEELPKMLAEKAKALDPYYTEEEIRNVLKSIVEEVKRVSESSKNNRSQAKTQKEGLMAILSVTSNSIPLDELQKRFRLYEGYYYAYIKWFEWDENKNTKDLKISVYKHILRIGPIDRNLNIIKVELTTWNQLSDLNENDDKWVYKGIMVPVSGDTSYFILEHVSDPSYDGGYTFIITHNYKKQYMAGIFTVAPPKRRTKQSDFVMASTRIVLKKIGKEEVAKGDVYLMDKMGYYEPDQLSEELTPEIIDLLNRESENGVFRVF